MVATGRVPRHRSAVLVACIGWISDPTATMGKVFPGAFRELAQGHLSFPQGHHFVDAALVPELKESQAQPWR